MKRLLTKSTMRLAALLALLFASASVAMADNDLGQLEIGKEYAFQGMFVVNTGVFTPPASGNVTVSGINAQYFHTDEACENEVDATFLGYAPVRYTFQVEKGKNIYFRYKDFDGGTFTLFMDGIAAQPLELLTVNPAPGRSYNLASDYVKNLYVNFNQNITCDANATLTYLNSKTTRSLKAVNGGTFVEVPVQQTVLNDLLNGVVKQDEKFTVEIFNISSSSGEKYNGNGTLKLEYICPNVPVKLMKQSGPTVFKSYWAPGDPDGILTLEFDGEIEENPQTRVDFGYGNKEGSEADYYYEVILPKFDGNKLIFDLTGKLRTPSTMIPNSQTQNYSTVDFKVCNVRDKYGNPVASEGQGTEGSYTYPYKYELIAKGNVVAAFDPENGESIKGLTEISVWITGLKTIKFDGFKFERYENGNLISVVVPLADCEFEKGDTDEEGFYFITIPAEMKDKSGVTVSLNNIIAADGYDHSSDVMASYDSFVITYASIEDGTDSYEPGCTLPYLYAEKTEKVGNEWVVTQKPTIFTIETNYTDKYPEMYIIYQIVDENAEDPDQAIAKSESWLNRQKDGKYTSEVFQDVKLYRGHRYRVEFEAWASEMDKNYREPSLGTDFFYIYGDTPAYKYSDVQFISIDPSEDTRLSKEDRTFAVTFDGLVTLEPETTFINVGMGVTQKFESMTPKNPQTNDDGTTYSDIWTLVVPQSYMESLTAQLTLSMKPFDTEGLVVRGPEGIEEGSYFYFTYETAGRFADFDVCFPDHAEAVETLSEIWATSEIGINHSGNVRVGDAYIMKKAGGEVVARVVEAKGELDDVPIEEVGDRQNTVVYLTLDTPIKEEGAYVMYFPENYFNVGSEFNQYNSIEKYYDFNVGVAKPVKMNVTVTPAEGKVTSLSSIDIIFNDCEEVGLSMGKASLIINGGAPISLPDADYGEAWNEMVQNLDKEYTADGEYVISFPAGYFDLDGVASPYFILTYTIGEEKKPEKPNVTVTPAEGKVSKLSSVDIIFNDYSEVGAGNGKATLSINGGASINLPDADFGEEWNEMIQNLDKEYTAAGEYVINFPEGYFVFGAMGDVLSPEFQLVYTIEDPNALPHVMTLVPAHNTDVKELKEVVITFDEYEEIGLNSGKAELYIDGKFDSQLDDATYDDNTPINGLIQPLGKTHTANGLYEVRFPAGYFLLINKLARSEEASKEFTLKYTIGNGQTGINGIFNINDGKTRVYTLDGVMVLESDNADDMKNLPAGIYIVNGTKILMK